MSTGTELRDAGTEAVLAADVAPHRGFAEHVEDALAFLIASPEPFTAEDVRDMIPDHAPEPHSANVLPAVMSGARAAGRIRAVGYTQSSRASRHAGVIRIWVASDSKAVA